MQCHFCGLQTLPDSATYCTRCGKDQRTPITPIDQPNWFERNANWSLAIAFFLASVIVILMGVWHDTTTPPGRLNEDGPLFRYTIAAGFLLLVNGWILRKKMNLWHLAWIIPIELSAMYFIVLR